MALRKEKNNPGTLDSTSRIFAKLGQIFSIIGFLIFILSVLYILLILGVFSGGIGTI
jgi:hypothetical protein